MQFNPPAITTIIPTYRRPQMLDRAIRSVLNQTYSNLKVCVYDNASGDETANIVSEIVKKDSRVMYHCHSENIGMIANFNYGMQCVNTPFFSILCDDDILLPDFFQKAIEGFKKHPEAMLSSGSVILMTENGDDIIRFPILKEGYFLPPNGILNWQLGKHPLISSSLFRREVITNLGFLENLLIADYEFELRLIAQYPYIISKTPFSIVISHQTNNTKLSSPDLWLDNLQRMGVKIQRNEALSPQLKNRVAEMIRKDFSNLFFKKGIKSSIDGNFADANGLLHILRYYFKDYRRFLALKFLIFISRFKTFRKFTKDFIKLKHLLRNVQNRHLRTYRSFL